MYLPKLACISLFATIAASASYQISTQPPSLDNCWEASKNIDELLSLYAQQGESWMEQSRDAIGQILQSIAEAGTTIKRNCEKLQSIGDKQSYQEAEQNAADLFGKDCLNHANAISARAVRSAPAGGTPLRLAIMCTSQELHDEISHYLYGNFELGINITSSIAPGSWIEFELPRIRAKWQVASVTEAITREFGEFPFHKVHATKLSDRGQVVLRWERLNLSISFLSVRRPAKRITLVFQNEKDLWLRDQRWRRNPAYDHESLALQLLRVENCSDIRIPQAENNKEGLVWTCYHDALSHVFPPTPPEHGSKSPNRPKDTTLVRPQAIRRHKQREQRHTKKRVKYWLGYLLDEEDEKPCQCGPEAHEVKEVEITHKYAPNKYPERSYDFTESEDDCYNYTTEVYIRQTDPTVHYTCG
ncbi:uncharacterized protein KD926_001621 [Aspergillus affinis]|uniref:uncharacterized protein n=1 Tax=Aspergillus affinis TaxID=1070780 RepID=UPI0022FEF14C|nr:uncharacterized protein KD926_001621 [Aspergillus affinis]KAI9036608.1 hypothetical protein KD926_001621 [Aspergillus affinis]